MTRFGRDLDLMSGSHGGVQKVKLKVVFSQVHGATAGVQTATLFE